MSEWNEWNESVQHDAAAPGQNGLHSHFPGMGPSSRKVFRQVFGRGNDSDLAPVGNRLVPALRRDDRGEPVLDGDFRQPVAPPFT